MGRFRSEPRRLKGLLPSRFGVRIPSVRCASRSIKSSRKDASSISFTWMFASRAPRGSALLCELPGECDSLGWNFMFSRRFEG